MSTKFDDLLAERGYLLADGATGTNYFAMGLEAGDAPELWNASAPDKVRDLHRRFIQAGSDLILTNTFGGNRYRLALHDAQERVRELNRLAAENARAEADAAGRPVIVAGSMGPTGSILEPVGDLSPADAMAAFTEQATGLAEGGADVLWIETISSQEEAVCAVEGAATTGLPIIATLSFDTSGRTMMGLKPEDWPGIVTGLPAPLAGFGANCGVGAAELIASVLAMVKAAAPDAVIVSKGNCGVPQFVGTEIVYSGTPELMADYARLARDSGARIIGGCCGTSPEHVAAMRAALDGYEPGAAPDIATVVARLGEVSDLVHGTDNAAEGASRRRRRRA